MKFEEKPLEGAIFGLYTAENIGIIPKNTMVDLLTTGADGTVRSLTDSIRLENPEKLDVLTDSTLLTGIENVSGDESFTMDGQTLTWKANGKDVTYQGTSDRPLPVTPVVTATLNGEEVPASRLKDEDGEIVLTVTYSQPDAMPHLAVSAILLPESGISDLTVENGTVFSLSGRQAVLGWAVPGADAALKLPADVLSSVSLS